MGERVETVADFILYIFLGSKITVDGDCSHSFWKFFLCLSPVAYWAPTDLGSSSFSVLSFCLFILFMGVLKSGLLKWFANGPRFVRTLHHVGSFLDLHCVAHTVHVIRLVTFLWLWLLVWWRRVRGSWKLPDRIEWLRGKLGLILMWGAMLGKSLIQFSVEGQGCVPSLLFDLRPNHGGGDEDNSDLLQQAPGTHCYTQCPHPAAGHHRPTPPPETPGHLRASLGQTLLGSLLLSPASWCSQVSVCALQESVSPVLYKFWQLCGGVNGDLLQEGLCHTQVRCTQSPSPCGGPLPETGPSQSQVPETPQRPRQNCVWVSPGEVRGTGWLPNVR